MQTLIIGGTYHWNIFADRRNSKKVDSVRLLFELPFCHLIAWVPGRARAVVCGKVKSVRSQTQITPTLSLGP
jgi:hypothetical protein